MLDVRIFGDPVLRKVAKPVEKFDSSLQKFIEDMFEALRVEDGVGLAAPQVGESIQLVVIDITGGEKDPIVLINPVIYNASEQTECADEGCLSIPGVTLSVNRPVRVSVKARDAEGKEFIIENAEGLLARAIQHETDHLHGLMIVDHVSALQKTMIGKKLKKLKKSSRDKSQD
ncbi:MAG TPA: peptide deformylase [Chitinispirillaceae bacterium]|nr:peptide deformylase [Chitinispirillaceae bacterium]